MRPTSTQTTYGFSFGPWNISTGAARSAKPFARRWNTPASVHLAGNRDVVSFTSGTGREAECITAAGDHMLNGGWKERGRVFINRLSDGSPVGVLDPGPSVGGVESTGWIDILTGITAHQRQDGEYLIFVEEDYKAEALMYRWRP